MRVTSILVSIGAVCLMACGESAEDQCNDVVGAVCDKARECSKLEGDPALDLENACLKALKPACQDAKDELDDVDSCVDAIKDSSCSSIGSGSDIEIPDLKQCSKAD